MKTAEELKAELIALFPAFADEFEDPDALREAGFDCRLTLHSVWMDFAPVAHACCIKASEKNLKKFGALINAEVAAGGHRENAVSTAFLEHASQVSVAKILRSVLSAEAQKKMR